jgi:hypothetical protein
MCGVWRAHDLHYSTWMLITALSANSPTINLSPFLLEPSPPPLMLPVSSAIATGTWLR